MLATAPRQSLRPNFDEIGFSIHPVLLGGGTPAFQPINRRVELELIEARPIAEGCVFVRWAVVN